MSVVQSVSNEERWKSHTWDMKQQQFYRKGCLSDSVYKAPVVTKCIFISEFQGS